MSSVSKENMELLRQEMLEDGRIEELEAQEHEYNMRTDTDYFCEWVLDNLFRIGDGNNPTSLRDMIELLNSEIRKYDQDIDNVYEYFKEI